MDELLQTTEIFLREHQLWAGIIVGLIAFGESLVLVGMVVPATALMLLIGGLIGAGVLAPIPVLTGAIIGAILGDVVSYFIGRWAGPSVVHKWPLKRHKTGVAKARLFFRKYGFAAVFFGRFFGPLRCTVPLVAGIMSMDQLRFQIANVLSALVWAPLMLSPGWVTAKGASQAGAMGGGDWIGLSALATVFALSAGALIIWVLSRSGAGRKTASASAGSRNN